MNTELLLHWTWNDLDPKTCHPIAQFNVEWYFDPLHDICITQVLASRQELHKGSDLQAFNPISYTKIVRTSKHVQVWTSKSAPLSILKVNPVVTWFSKINVYLYMNCESNTMKRHFECQTGVFCYQSSHWLRSISSDSWHFF